MPTEENSLKYLQWKTANRNALQDTSNYESLIDSANVHVFGNSQFRLLQKEVITQVLQGGNAFVSLPTSGGKSNLLDCNN